MVYSPEEEELKEENEEVDPTDVQTDGSTEPSNTENGEKDREGDTGIRGAYECVLDNPASIPFNYDNYTPGSYQYTIVDVTADGVSEMLIARGTSELTSIVVFSQGSSREIISSEDILLNGAASRGGARYSAQAGEGGEGLYGYEGSVMRPNVNVKQYTVYGNQIA